MIRPIFTPHLLRLPLVRHLGIALLTACLGAGFTAPLHAQTTPYAEVQRLIDARAYPDALQRVQRHLQGQPRDPQMRFLQGVIQSQQGDDEAALATFTALTQDFPELPEPYNNLAVLHAKHQQLDQARAALEMAVRLNPRYATALQNLGDVHARLALQAYQEAVRLNPDNADARSRLSALQSTLNTPSTSR